MSKIKVLIRDKVSGQFVDKTDTVLDVKHIGEKYYITFSNGCEYPYGADRVKLCPVVKKASERLKDIYEYLGAIAKKVGNISFDNMEEEADQTVSSNHLFNAFKKIDMDCTENALHDYYLGKLQKRICDEERLIYPFGCNVSQKKAVAMALNNNISVIEGPPGTGKTQTILNIIANVLSKGQTIAIVSNNNSAVSNVQEKLEKGGYGFLTAMLGKQQNQSDFFSSDHSYKLSEDWKLDRKTKKAYEKKIERLSRIIEKHLEIQNELALLRTRLTDAEIEYKHVRNENVLADDRLLKVQKVLPRRWKSRNLVNFKCFLDIAQQYEKLNSFQTKFKLFFKYRIFRIKRFYSNVDEILPDITFLFYDSLQSELHAKIKELETYLKKADLAKTLKDYTQTSECVFKACLYDRYAPDKQEKITKEIFEKHFSRFIERFPVVLSTTHSILSSTQKDYLFDYIIIDESSQVDIITASLAFSCCRNVVVVGDARQLTHIVSNKDVISGNMREQFDIPEAYDYVGCNILTSLKKMYDAGLPVTLLREHYRCHPQIIGYCNKKFYNNELVIMTSAQENSLPFQVISTNIGGYQKELNYNHRQLEVIKDEIIPSMGGAQYTEIGIISPYRYHTDQLQKSLPPEIEADTIHKFQGREKNIIIFNTVRDEINSFIDKSNLINVAVSRAKERFVIVKPGNMRLPHGSNIGDLVRYIKYTDDNPDAFIESNIRSVFDLLYKEYREELIRFRKNSKRVSQYDSENIMYVVLCRILEQEKYNCLSVAVHYVLRDLIPVTDRLDEREKTYVRNGAHVDFIVYNKINKKTVLTIEVDGVAFHSDERQKERDKLKTRILEKYHIPLLRLRTDCSDEEERIEKILELQMQQGADMGLN